MPKKTKEDPTGLAGNRNRGTRKLTRRLRDAERRVKQLFRAIPKSSRRQKKVVNAETATIYDYALSTQEKAQLEQSIQYVINEALLDNQNGQMSADWYFKPDIEQPYRQGTAEETRDFNQLIAAAIIAGAFIEQVPVEQVLFSPVYADKVLNAQTDTFRTIKGLSEKTTAQVLQKINTGIQSGMSPTVIVNDISTRFDVSIADAKRISETEINKAYNNAKMDTTRLLSDRTGLKAGVVHVSALTPTTRAHHAARHGNAYTVEDQRQWWDEGANRINCKCSVKSILIGKDGRVVESGLAT